MLLILQKLNFYAIFPLAPLFFRGEETMTNEELLSAIRGVVREEVNAGEQRMRTLVREEVNTAVYASEQRTGERLDKMDERLDKMDGRLDKMDGRLDKMDGRLDKMDEHLDKVDGRLNRLEGMVLPMAEHLRLIKAEQKQMQADMRDMQINMTNMKADIEQVTGILDLVTLRINDFERNQHNLENKVEGYLTTIHHDVERIHNTLTFFSKEFNSIVRKTHARLDEHENASLDETHPQRSPF